METIIVSPSATQTINELTLRQWKLWIELREEFTIANKTTQDRYLKCTCKKKISSHDFHLVRVESRRSCQLSIVHLMSLRRQIESISQEHLWIWRFDSKYCSWGRILMLFGIAFESFWPGKSVAMSCSADNRWIFPSLGLCWWNINNKAQPNPTIQQSIRLSSSMNFDKSILRGLSC